MPHAKRLLEANDIINSRHHLTHVQLEIVRTVALLNALSEICPLRATPQMIRSAVANTEPVEQELEFLRQQSVVTYRRLDNSYRVWEGSDVDIEARINEGRRKLQLESVSPLEGESFSLRVCHLWNLFAITCHLASWLHGGTVLKQASTGISN